MKLFNWFKRKPTQAEKTQARAESFKLQQQKHFAWIDSWTTYEEAKAGASWLSINARYVNKSEHYQLVETLQKAWRKEDELKQAKDFLKSYQQKARVRAKSAIYRPSNRYFYLK
jgi:hypothetical protein